MKYYQPVTYYAFCSQLPLYNVSGVLKLHDIIKVLSYNSTVHAPLFGLIVISGQKKTTDQIFYKTQVFINNSMMSFHFFNVSIHT